MLVGTGLFVFKILHFLVCQLINHSGLTSSLHIHTFSSLFSFFWVDDSGYYYCRIRRVAVFPHVPLDRSGLKDIFLFY